MQIQAEYLFQPHTRHVVYQSGFLDLQDMIVKFKRQQEQIFEQCEKYQGNFPTPEQICKMVQLDHNIRELTEDIDKARRQG